MRFVPGAEWSPEERHKGPRPWGGDAESVSASAEGYSKKLPYRTPSVIVWGVGSFGSMEMESSLMHCFDGLGHGEYRKPPRPTETAALDRHGPRPFEQRSPGRMLVSWVLHASLMVLISCLSVWASASPMDFGPGSASEIYKQASPPLWIHRFDPPGHAPQTDRRPAAVFFFGGGWTGGTVRQFEQHARYLAGRGMVTFLADYRVRSRHGVEPDACVADGKSAIRWVRANAERLGVDPDRIAAGGGSAGGHVAAAAGICDGLEDPTDGQPRVSSKPDALLLFNPVYDNSPQGYGHDRIKAWFPAISPADNITADDPPTIVFLGTEDTLVPVPTAVAFDARLRAHGIRSELHLSAGQPHGFFNEAKNQRCFLDTILRMDAFLVSLQWLTGSADKVLLRSLLHTPPPRPNIVVILCDDLGYGDVHCLNPDAGRIPTPHADRLATEGIVFKDAHAAASVCTPTRYGLLTGRYGWRTRLQAGVVTGFAPCLIAADRPTVATFLRDQGYETAIIGKWHLNWIYRDGDSGRPLEAKDHPLPPIGARIEDGPLSHGFGSFHGFHHARMIEAVHDNDRVIAHEEAVTMLPRLTRQAVGFIESRSDRQEPFFLYLPLSAPHTPILPAPEWRGRSGLGAYGDFVMQTDHSVGEILDALARNNLVENTLVIFTSDNGCSKAAGISALAEQGHRVSGPFHGSKADLWDGGHRVPFIVRWPGHICPGTQSDATICLTDVFATVADLLVEDLPANSGEDSVSFQAALHGNPAAAGRAGIVHHSISGHFAYRHDRWKLLLAYGSGGWSSPTEREAVSLPEAERVQLYDMQSDPGEQRNLAATRPDVVATLRALLEADVSRGRSTAGPAASNDVDSIRLWKSEAPDQEPEKKTRRKAPSLRPSSHAP